MPTPSIRIGCSGWNYRDWRGRVYLGPGLWQLPERMRADPALLAAALDELPPGRHCFEFRHPSWFSDEVLELLRWHGVALVIAIIRSARGSCSS